MDSLTSLFWTEGLKYIKHSNINSTVTSHRKFRSFYGVSPNVCAHLWRLIRIKPDDSRPCHLLWSLLFLRCYNVEDMNASIVEVDPKTFRKWTWKLVNAIAELEIVGF